MQSAFHEDCKLNGGFGDWAGSLWHEKTPDLPGFFEEASVGFEPTMADLQSAALATWPRRRVV